VRFDGITAPREVKALPFPDVEIKHWAAPVIAAAKEAGLLEYLVGKNFEPNRELTRAEAAEMLSKTKFGKDKIKELLE